MRQESPTWRVLVRFSPECCNTCIFPRCFPVWYCFTTINLHRNNRRLDSWVFQQLKFVLESPKRCIFFCFFVAVALKESRDGGQRSTWKRLSLPYSFIASAVIPRHYWSFLHKRIHVQNLTGFNQNIHEKGECFLDSSVICRKQSPVVQADSNDPPQGHSVRMWAEMSWRPPPCLFCCFLSAVTKTLHNGWRVENPAPIPLSAPQGHGGWK